MVRIFLILIFICFGNSYAQNNSISLDNNYNSNTFSFNKQKTEISDFFVNPINQVFIALNGGVFIPNDSIWFLEPKADKEALSYSAIEKDTGFYLITQANQVCYLKYYHIDKEMNINIHTLTKFEKGRFNLLIKNNKLIIWGVQNGMSKIGTVNKDQNIEWVIEIKEKITSVDIDDKGIVLFSVGKYIYSLNSTKPLFGIDTLINSFCLISADEYLISTPIGLYKKQFSNYQLILQGVEGPVKFKNEKIYLLSNKFSCLYEISPNLKQRNKSESIPPFNYKKETLNGVVKVFYPIKPNYFCYNDIEVLSSGYPIIPCDSGAFIPGLNKFYYKEYDKKIHSIAITKSSSAAYYVNRTKRGNSINMINYNNSTINDQQIMKLGKGNYFLRIVNDNSFYCYGKESNGVFRIYRYSNHKFDTIYTSNKIISQLDIINNETIIFNEDSAIITLTIGSKPQKIFQCSDLIEGVSTSRDGSIFFSTELGVFRLNKEYELNQITTQKIHGKLRCYKSGFYILNTYYPSIIEIQDFTF